MEGWQHINALFDRCREVPHLPISFMGFGLLQLWGCYVLNGLASPVRTMVNAFPLLQGSLLYQNIYFIAQVVTFVAMGALARTRSPYYLRTGFSSVAFLALYAFEAVLFVGMYRALSPLAIAVSAIVAGIAYAYWFMLYVELLGCLSGTLMIVGYLLGSLVYFATSLASHYMELPLQVAVFLLLPALIAVGHISSMRSLDEGILPKAIEHRVAIPWQILLLVVVFSIVFDLSGGFILYSKTEVLVRLGRLIPIFIILWFTLFSRRFDFATFYRLIVIFMIIGLSFALFFDRDSLIGQITSQSGAESFSLLVFVIVCSYAYRLHISSTVFYGPVIAINLAFRLVYDNFAEAYPQLVDSMAVTVPLLVTGILVLLFIFNKPDFVDKIRPIPPAAVDRRKAFDEFSQSLGLTPQERVIALALGEEKGVPQIADELFISQSTVRVHMSSIYKKAGIHSKEELIQAMNERQQAES